MVVLRGLLASCLVLLPAVSANEVGCGTDNCLQAVNWYPWISGEVETFCERYIHSTACTSAHKTKTVTTTVAATGGPHTVEVSSTTTVDVTAPTQFISLSTTITLSSTDLALSTETSTASTTVTDTITQYSVCTTTTTETASALSTSVDYVSRPPSDSTVTARAANLDFYQANPSVANLCNHGCDGRRAPFSARLSSACSCYLDKPRTTTVTKTVTSSVGGPTTLATSIDTVVVTEPGATLTTLLSYTSVVDLTPTAITTSTSTVYTTVTSCNPSSSSTSTTVTFAVASFVCGNTFAAVPTASTSGSVTCANTVPTPSANALFRIEGLQSGEGTIFEGCIVSGPRNVTTPSGGTHECDGTNDGANASPGTTPTDQIDAAGQENGFGYDGTYESQYQDYFITSISDTTQGGNDYWGILNNYQYTPTGGCQFEVDQSSATAWIFNAFNYNAFLEVTPSYAVAEAGSGSVTVTITDGMSGNPFVGASFAGGTSGSGGQISIAVPDSPGCYQYKAFANGAAPSNAFYLSVFPDGTFSSS